MSVLPAAGGVTKQKKAKKQRPPVEAVPIDQDHPGNSKFARALGSSDHLTREKGLQALTLWLTRKADLDELDVTKIWKGLFYCFWHSDMAPVQLELAERLAGILPQLSQEAAFLFFTVFMRTMRREWFGIDRLRLDKFLMLIRKFVHQMLQCLKAAKWNVALVSRYAEFVQSEVLLPTDHIAAAGVAYHLGDLLPQELSKVAGEKAVPAAAMAALLRPFVAALATGEQAAITRIRDGLFETLLDDLRSSLDGSGDDGDGEGDGSGSSVAYLGQLDVGQLAALSFDRGAQPETLARNRQALYELSSALEKVQRKRQKRPAAVAAHGGAASGSAGNGVCTPATKGAQPADSKQQQQQKACKEHRSLGAPQQAPADGEGPKKTRKAAAATDQEPPAGPSGAATPAAATPAADAGGKQGKKHKQQQQQSDEQQQHGVDGVAPTADGRAGASGRGMVAAMVANLEALATMPTPTGRKAPAGAKPAGTPAVTAKGTPAVSAKGSKSSGDGSAAKEPTTGWREAMRAAVQLFAEQAGAVGGSQAPAGSGHKAGGPAGAATATAPASGTAPLSTTVTPVAARGGSKRGRKDTAGPATALASGAAGAGGPSSSASAKTNRVRINLKRNLYFEAGGPVPEPDVRTPPPARSKGSILKKASTAARPTSAPPKLSGLGAAAGGGAGGKAGGARRQTPQAQQHKQQQQQQTKKTGGKVAVTPRSAPRPNAAQFF